MEWPTEGDVLIVAGRLRGKGMLRGECGQLEHDAVREALRCAHPFQGWFEAHDRYHKASASYNERLQLVRAERERGNWSMTTDKEYADLGAAQSAAMQANNDLYAALKDAR